MLSELVNRSRALPAGSKLLILGAGYSGSTVAALTEALGTPVLRTRRQPDGNANTLPFDSTNGIRPTREDLQGVTHVLSTIPPERNGQDPVLSQLLADLLTLPLNWVGYLSTTGVYGDHNGDWVSETTEATPGQERSQRRLACEDAWRNSGLPVQILRLPGIYGPGRSILANLRDGRARRIIKPGQVFCRIHVEDIAGACLHLIHAANRGERPSLVNIVDDHPAPSHELLDFAAELLDQPQLPSEDFATASTGMSAMAQSFWAENRRVSNALLCKTLGYRLLHPNFQAGLRDCFLQDAIKMTTLSRQDHQSTNG